MATKNENEMRIVGAVRHKGRLFTAGSEAELAKSLPRKDIDRLVGKGVLTGNWGGTAKTAAGAVERLDGQPMARGEDGLVHGEPITGDGTGVALPPIEDGAAATEGTSEAPAKKAKKPAAKRAAKGK